MSATHAVSDATLPATVTAPSSVIAHAHIPQYLKTHYWWAYIHPAAVRIFERQWLVNLILWGNYVRLRDVALDALGQELPGETLQMACVYGDLSSGLGERAASAGGTVDVVDVLPIQLRNLRRKLAPQAPVRALAMDSAKLDLPPGRYDRALAFFLLHEQPEQVRKATLGELCRVVKPGGRIVIVDYAAPRRWNPLRYLWRPLLAVLEPFALDLWRQEIADWLPPAVHPRGVVRRSFFGGLYQMVVIER